MNIPQGRFGKSVKLSAVQQDRAAGAVVGLAAGDALGAGYEFKPAVADSVPVFMKGGGGYQWAPGEWTDDTSMAIPILDFFARGERCDANTPLDQIVVDWVDWAKHAPDVGNQTRSVLTNVRNGGKLTEAQARLVAESQHQRSGKSAGNGSLMRTAPVSLGYLGDGEEQQLIAASRRLSELTHWEESNWQATAIWNLAIRHAILTGEIAIQEQITFLPQEVQGYWNDIYSEAVAHEPVHFSASNGWVVAAFQGAVSAIVRGKDFADIVERAVRGGEDTDTVAAIAGSLAGAKYGYSAMPANWLRLVHGWPGYRAADLMRLAVLAVNGGQADSATGWPAADTFPPTELDAMVPHPHDSGVYLASMAGLDRLPAEVSHVVSLARIGKKQTDRQHIEFWLVDKDGSNANTELTIEQAVAAVAELRAEGKTVALHCLEARSRTVAVAAAYAVLHRGVALEQAWADLQQALPQSNPNRFLKDAVEKLAEHV